MTSPEPNPEIRAYALRVAAEAPPFSEEQRGHLALIFGSVPVARATVELPEAA